LTAHRVFNRLRYLVDAGLTLLFPPTCVGCKRLGELFCAACAQAVEATPDPICARCGLAQPRATQRCANCLSHSDYALQLTRAAALHTWPLREAIHAFKYQEMPDLAPLLARYLVAVYADAPWVSLRRPITAVVPVPLHEQRLAERGYNQAELLAAHFCRAVKLPLQPNWVTRIRETRQQVGLGPAERKMNVQGAFAATRAAGAETVYGLTLAQPVRRPHPYAPADVPEADEMQDASWWEGEV
jgi:predicted amidophosphoribosyltransferase